MNPRGLVADDLVFSIVDGVPTASSNDDPLEVVNPANGRVCVTIPVGCEADVNRSVESARAAFEDGRWSEAAPSSRKRVLHRFADLVAENSGTLDALDAEEMGKPISERFCSASASAGLVRFYAEAVDKITGDVFSSDHFSYVTQRRVPRGVVAALASWNFPTYVALLKVAPALAAGNCVVLKPSESSSRSAVLLARLAIDAGLPPGVFNVVLGKGEVVGSALGLHRSVDMITLTGSTLVGKKLLEYAGQSNMKAVHLECGGKSPQIVFADGVDLDDAAAGIAASLLVNQGQVCSVGSRLLVDRRIEKDLIARILHRLKQIRMGDPLDPHTTFGPVASPRQCSRVMDYVNIALAEGATLVAGGRRVQEASGGYFVEPTLFTGVSPLARVAQEEIFGPVLSAITFDSEDEAVRLANGTAYGLSAYVWTANLGTALRVAKGIRSSVRINAAAPVGEGSGYAASQEPAGESGLGPESGLAGMESYLRRQRIWFSHP